MRSIYILIGIIFLLTGCSTPAMQLIDMQLVNNHFNQIEYVSDDPDLPYDDWKTIQRFMEEGGDCEDYAIAKYHALKDSHYVVILVGEVDFGTGQPRGGHAVLLVDKVWVLDNNFNEILTLPQYVDKYKMEIWGYATPSKRLITNFEWIYEIDEWS